MANTIVQSTQLTSEKHHVVHVAVTIVDVLTQDIVVYDSSAVIAALNALDTAYTIPDPLNCVIQSVRAQNNSSAGSMSLRFDATTDVEAICIRKNGNLNVDYCDFGGLKNYAGAGKTGDIILSLRGMTAGEVVTLTLVVKAI